MERSEHKLLCELIPKCAEEIIEENFPALIQGMINKELSWIPEVCRGNYRRKFPGAYTRDDKQRVKLDSRSVPRKLSKKISRRLHEG